ncbi:MAG: hypothetical protein ABI306_04505 [Caulobacteraceae bacterium]
MSLKLMAKEWLERNRPCNSPCNRPENRATRPATDGFPGATVADPAERFAERAAIIQEGAGVPAAWADGFARLEALPVPRGVDSAAWLAMMDAAGRFLDQWGGKAAALGWSAGELFGLDPDAPLNRRDKRGAAFYLVGAEVLAVTGEAITLRTGGAVHRSVKRGIAAPAWEEVS